MYSTEKILTKTGGITITKDLRYLTGLKPHDRIDVVVNDNNEIVIKKHVPTCFFCGSVDGTKRFKGYEVCKVCRANIKA